MQRLEFLTANPSLIPLELATCQQDILHWFDWWAWTYNPNLINPDGTAAIAHLPFDLFKRQREFVQWVLARIRAREDGLVEKSREIGFTYMVGGVALWHWRFAQGFKSAFASRNKDLVDTVGNADSIFEKMRIMRQAMPPWMLPPGFSDALHDNYCRLINPDTGDTIIGEGGEEIGRGGRNSLMIVDEAAFLTNGDRIDRSTSANSQCRIFGSTVNSPGDMFARKRHGGTLKPEQIFRFHFTDDPRKDAAWEARERARLEEHVFASEYDIDYSASVEGIAIPAKHVRACQKLKHVLAAKGIALEPDPRGVAGLDVGAGKARSVFIPRFGPIVLKPTSWGQPDTTETAFAALEAAAATRMTRANGTVCIIKTLRFDEPGVGKGVLSTLTRNKPEGIGVYGVNTGVPPSDTTWPDGKTAEEKFGNLKAELWMTVRERAKNTYEMVRYLEGQPGGKVYELSELLSLPDDSDGPDSQKLANELSVLKWFRNEKGKIVMETKVQLRKRGIASPDYADALVLTYDPDTTVEDWIKAFAS